MEGRQNEFKHASKQTEAQSNAKRENIEDPIVKKTLDAIRRRTTLESKLDIIEKFSKIQKIPPSLLIIGLDEIIFDRKLKTEISKYSTQISKLYNDVLDEEIVRRYETSQPFVYKIAYIDLLEQIRKRESIEAKLNLIKKLFKIKKIPPCLLLTAIEEMLVDKKLKTEISKNSVQVSKLYNDILDEDVERRYETSRQFFCKIPYTELTALPETKNSPNYHSYAEDFNRYDQHLKSEFLTKETYETRVLFLHRCLAEADRFLAKGDKKTVAIITGFFQSSITEPFIHKRTDKENNTLKRRFKKLLNRESEYINLSSHGKKVLRRIENLMDNSFEYANIRDASFGNCIPHIAAYKAMLEKQVLKKENAEEKVDKEVIALQELQHRRITSLLQDFQVETLKTENMPKLLPCENDIDLLDPTYLRSMKEKLINVINSIKDDASRTDYLNSLDILIEIADKTQQFESEIKYLDECVANEANAVQEQLGAFEEFIKTTDFETDDTSKINDKKIIVTEKLKELELKYPINSRKHGIKYIHVRYISDLLVLATEMKSKTIAEDLLNLAKKIGKFIIDCKSLKINFMNFKEYTIKNARDSIQYIFGIMYKPNHDFEAAILFLDDCVYKPTSKLPEEYETQMRNLREYIISLVKSEEAEQKSILSSFVKELSMLPSIHTKQKYLKSKLADISIQNTLSKDQLKNLKKLNNLFAEMRKEYRAYRNSFTTDMDTINRSLSMQMLPHPKIDRHPSVKTVSKMSSRTYSTLRLNSNSTKHSSLSTYTFSKPKENLNTEQITTPIVSKPDEPITDVKPITPKESLKAEPITTVALQQTETTIVKKEENLKAEQVTAPTVSTQTKTTIDVEKMAKEAFPFTLQYPTMVMKDGFSFIDPTVDRDRAFSFSEEKNVIFNGDKIATAVVQPKESKMESKETVDQKNKMIKTLPASKSSTNIKKVRKLQHSVSENTIPRIHQKQYAYTAGIKFFKDHEANLVRIKSFREGKYDKPKDKRSLSKSSSDPFAFYHSPDRPKLIKQPTVKFNRDEQGNIISTETVNTSNKGLKWQPKPIKFIF